MSMFRFNGLLVLFSFLLLFDLFTTGKLQSIAERNRAVLLKMQANQERILNSCAPRPERSLPERLLE